MYKLLFPSQAKKNAKNLSKSGLKQKTEQLLDMIEQDLLNTHPNLNF